VGVGHNAAWSCPDSPRRRSAGRVSDQAPSAFNAVTATCQPVGRSEMSILWIILIVIIVLALLGFLGRSVF
jgi:hypothetical protein